MVKKVVIAFCLLILPASLVLAGFTLPPHVYTVSKLKQAKAAAQAQNRALLFIFSDKNTTCPLCRDASTDVINGFKNRAVIVYVANTEFGKLPGLVVKAFDSPEAGEYIPKTVIVDPYVQDVIAIIPYSRRDRNVLFNDAQRKINRYFGRE